MSDELDKLNREYINEHPEIQQALAADKAERQRLKAQIDNAREMRKKLKELADIKDGKYLHKVRREDGMPVTSVEEARQIIDKHKFKLEVDILRSSIKASITQLKNDTTLELKEANSFIAKELQKLYEMPINDKEDLEFTQWLYNNGNLRTEKEVNQYFEDQYNYKYVASGDYEIDCFNRKTIGGFVGFLVPFSFCIAKFWDDWYILAFIPAIFFGLLFSLFGMTVATKMNLVSAEKHNVPKTHPRYVHDRNEMTIAGVAGVTSTISIFRHTKNAVKGITNVDSWKEFK